MTVFLFTSPSNACAFERDLACDEHAFSHVRNFFLLAKIQVKPGFSTARVRFEMFHVRRSSNY